MLFNNTCRDEILKAVHSLIENTGCKEFTVSEVIQKMKQNTTQYSDHTIRTHKASRCCINAEKHHHAVVYYDFERVSRGMYRLYRQG